MTNFERSLFEIAESEMREYAYAPDYAEDYAALWAEVEAYDVPIDHIPSEDEVWGYYAYDEYCKVMNSVNADILAYMRGDGVGGDGVGGDCEDPDGVFVAKDRTRATRRHTERRARDRHVATLENLGFCLDMLTEAEKTRKLSELYGRPCAWKKWHESSKKPRRDPSLSGKGCAYKRSGCRGYWD